MTDKPKRVPNPTGKNGKESALTPELIDQICAVLQRWAFMETAAKRIGISEETIRKWRQLGRAVIRGDEDVQHTPHALLCAEFVRRTDEQEADNELDAVDVIRESKDPKDAQWYLERRFNKRWSRNPNAHNVEVSININADGQAVDPREKLHEKLTVLIEQREIAARLALKEPEDS